AACVCHRGRRRRPCARGSVLGATVRRRRRTEPRRPGVRRRDGGAGSGGAVAGSRIVMRHSHAETPPPTILITGAAGNLGSLLSRHLVPTGHQLRLMYHRTPLPDEVSQAAHVRPIQADLGDPATLSAAVAGADVIVHFAGRLFAPRPASFLPETNTRWFSNLLTAGIQAKVSRIILISFPHVEGPTSVEQPATGRLDRRPISVHAQTR